MMVVKMSDKEGYFQYVLFTAHGEVLLIFFFHIFMWWVSGKCIIFYTISQLDG